MNELETTYSPEILTDDPRKHNSAELLRNPFEYGEELEDRIFITANVSNPHPHMWEVNVDSSYPTVVMNDKSRQELELFDVPTIQEVREGDSEISLVSNGSWVWIEDNDGNLFLPLLRRDAGASVDANCLTGAAGRCGEMPSMTAINETNQEFIFLHAEEESELKLLAFYKDESEKEKTIEQKVDQVQKHLEALQSAYAESGNEKYKKDIDDLLKFKGEENLELIQISQVENKAQELDTIYTKIDGEIVDITRGIAYMDEKNNTLEIRTVLQIVLPEGVKVSTLMDGESFLRDTMMVKKDDLASLEKDNLVPALRNYITRINVGKHAVKTTLT